MHRERYFDWRPLMLSDNLGAPNELLGEHRRKLSASGLSWGCSSEIDASGRVLYTADVYRKDGKRFTVVADDRLTAFLELERVTLEAKK